VALRLSPRRPAGPFGSPLRPFGGRILLGTLACACIALMVLAKADVQLLSFASQHAGDAASPLLRLLNAPVVAVRNAADRAGRLLALDAENERLRDENRRLLAWQAEATRLGVENRALREMLRVPLAPRATLSTAAQIVGDTGGPFVQSRLIDAGADRGLEPGMAVVTERGLAGRIVEVGARSARVLLLTDFNSRVPVLVESSRDRAILQGDNSDAPTLRFLPMNPTLAVGDRVLTSGDGGVLPAGLLVGQIGAVQDGEVMVAPFVDWDRLDWVAVLRSEPVAPPQPPRPTGPS
jgi:rod shape-determining protein MreC